MTQQSALTSGTWRDAQNTAAHPGQPTQGACGSQQAIPGSYMQYLTSADPIPYGGGVMSTHHPHAEMVPQMHTPGPMPAVNQQPAQSHLQLAEMNTCSYLGHHDAWTKVREMLVKKEDSS